MARSSASPLQPSHAERRALLSRHFVDAVEPLLEAGEQYADISVERLIKAVDISRSTFYVYFEDKGELLSAMAEDVTRDLADAGSAWFELAHDAGKDGLREALRPLFDTYRRHQALLGAVSEVASYDARVRERHLALVQTAISGLERHLIDAQAAGAAAPELDPRRTAAWLTWMHERGLHQLAAPASPEEAGRLLDAMTDLVWRALYSGYR
ncbi:MAG TPA: TetR/AcrR family transcriptional regulator [Baekduia sp.]|nr:TetR/AcrR family transcriptional regulator [Baekduia sp.]